MTQASADFMSFEDTLNHRGIQVDQLCGIRFQVKNYWRRKAVQYLGVQHSPLILPQATALSILDNALKKYAEGYIDKLADEEMEMLANLDRLSAKRQALETALSQ